VNLTEPVVVGFDGSRGGMAALRYAADEAALRDRPLSVVHAFTWPAALMADQVDYLAHAPDPRVHAEHLVSGAAAEVRANHPTLEVRTHAVFGTPVSVLLDHSQQAALLVVGSRGHGGFAGLLAGSTSAHVATHASVPVVVVRGGPRPAGAPVLLGVDTARPSHVATAFAFEEAALRRVSLRAFAGWSSETIGWSGSHASDLEDEQREARRRLDEALAGWREKYPRVVVDLHAVYSLDPPHALARAADGAVLTVIGSRGRGELRSFLLGSCGYLLLHRADSPVAIVRDTLPTAVTAFEH
jgi:nucleotide-binding universal stress UspA family protein